MIRTSGIRNEIEIHDPKFFYLSSGNTWVETLHSGMYWAEGPVYFADGVTSCGAIYQITGFSGGLGDM